MISALCILLSASLGFTPTPADTLRARTILVELAQHNEESRSMDVNDHGQCRRFQADSFAKAAEGFTLSEYPGVTLYLPLDHAKQEVSGRPAGTCWDMPDASTGNAFVEAARFEFDAALPEGENVAVALEFLTNVRAGDMLQMVGRYNSGGRGTHTLMFTQPYDPRSEYLYWSDSNFANRRVDGIRYGSVRAYQRWTLREVAGWLASEGNNGATLYRLRDDVTAR